VRLATIVAFLALAIPPAAQAQTEHQTTWKLRVLVTSYCLSGHTRSGTSVHWGSIAVDPSLIRMGARIFVPRYGYGRAEDTGSAIIGHHIDTWMPSCYAALRSTRYETITVYR
jgi:3D (Asp-Asp-Asp) domain-containing protein